MRSSMAVLSTDNFGKKFLVNCFAKHGDEKYLMHYILARFVSRGFLLRRFIHAVIEHCIWEVETSIVLFPFCIFDEQSIRMMYGWCIYKANYHLVWQYCNNQSRAFIFQFFIDANLIRARHKINWELRRSENLVNYRLYSSRYLKW